MKKLLFIISIVLIYFSCEDMYGPFPYTYYYETNYVNTNLFVRDSSLLFYDNGAVKEGKLNSSQFIQGIYFKGDPELIYFYSNGYVKQGRLEGNQVLEGTRYYSNEYIRLYRYGSIRSGSSVLDSNFNTNT